MPKAIEQLYEQALKLSEKARGDLAARLIDSLDPHTDAEVESAWAAEIQRRLDEIDSGKAKLVPWKRARTMILRTKHDRSSG